VKSEVFIIKSEKETEEFAKNLIPLLKPSVNFGLVGGLGAGKTTLVRYLVALLGSKDSVSSPTFVLQHFYDGKDQLVIEHWDLYRLKSAPLEILERPEKNVIRMIEWPEKAPELMQELDILLEIEFLTGKLEERKFTLYLKSPELE